MTDWDAVSAAACSIMVSAKCATFGSDGLAQEAKKRCREKTIELAKALGLKVTE